MRPDVCATLTAVFPLVLLAIIAQRPTIRPLIRVHRLYRLTVRVSVTVSLTGLLGAVAGQQLGGLSLVPAVFISLLLTSDVLCLGVTVLAAMASYELDEERADGRRQNQRRAARRSLRSNLHS